MSSALGKIKFQAMSQCAPANDDFADALVLVGASGSADPVEIDCATVEASEESGSCYGNPSWQTIWYSFTAPANGTLTADTYGSLGNDPFLYCGGATLFTVLTAYTGVALGSLSEVACNDVDPGAPAGECASLISFAVTSGVTYMLQVSTGYGPTNDSGFVILNWSFV